MTQATGGDLTRSLRDLAIGQLGVGLFGVAPAERLDGGPEGGRPTDYLPTARSVIVLAAKILDAVVEVAGHYDQPGKTLGPYMWYGYPVLNWDLSSAANRLARSIEEHGFRGLPSPPQACSTSMGIEQIFPIDTLRWLPALARSGSAAFC